MQIGKERDGAYARRLLRRARVRAKARRQLWLGLRIVVAGAFVAAVSMIGSGGQATAKPPDNMRPSISAPRPHQGIMFASARLEAMPS
jgi:hypothetical protein